MNRLSSLCQTACEHLLDALCPRQCVLCGLQQPDEPICHLCRPHLPYNDLYCERCAMPMHAQQASGVHCADCQAKPPPFSMARAPFRYAFPVDSAIKALKFNGKLYHAPALASYLSRELQQMRQDIDALVPVPLHRWRHARRGFNQAIELCKPVSRSSGLPILRNVRRVRSTMPQSGLDAKERRRNLRDAFAVVGRLRCRYPLIVDDVVTTGATSRQLALKLLAHGAESVAVLSVARSASLV